MRAEPVFPNADRSAGMYESFYLRAVSPAEPLGVWIRHTVHKPPAGEPAGSIWCTVFDAARGRPFMHKVTSELLRRPEEGWIEVGGEAQMGPGLAEGRCGPARWSLRFEARSPELRHLRPGLLYRTPLPRTKLTSPAPLASFDGTVELPGREPIELRGWPGMVGHNWGAEHAARWIWLHGCDFADAPGAWLDLALGRLLVGSRLTPWVANGVLCLDGERHRLGGVLGARPQVSERPDGARLELRGQRGSTVRVEASVPPETAAGWRYADPGSSGAGQPNEHDVVNCSIARLEVVVGRRGAPARRLVSDHGGAYELGMKERDHGVPIAPFGDG
jgi:hypothetical protein